MSFPSSSPAANTFLVDSLISACRTDGFYTNGNMYTPSGSDVGTYGMQTCGLLPPFGKRGEVNHHNMGMNVHPYISQIDHWTEPSSRACRTESSGQMSNYTFSHQSIKEESNCCMYSEKRLHKVGSPEVVSSYPTIPESCSLDGPEIPVPGYFRLSQTYANGKQQQEGFNCQQPPSPNSNPNPTLMQLSRVTPKPQSSSSSSSSLSSNFLDTERKNDDLAHEPDPSSTPIAAENQSPEPESDCVERMCSMDASVSSPEEVKGRQ